MMPRFLANYLGLFFYVVLLGGVAVVYRATARPSAAKWKVDSKPELTPETRLPLTRTVIAFAGSTLLAMGSVIPASPLVRSAAVATPDVGKVLYVVFAMLAVVFAATRHFRVLYLVGGIPLVLLLVVGFESTMLMQKIPHASEEYYSETFGLGWSWGLMLIGTGLMVLSAALHPAHSVFKKPPPLATRRRPFWD
jgi:hypothetical protein